MVSNGKSRLLLREGDSEGRQCDVVGADLVDGGGLMGRPDFHKRRHVTLCVVLALIFSVPTAWAGAVRSSGLIGEGTAWETSFYVVDNGRDGPAVMIVGGIHGNEPAGSRAAEQILCWRIVKGRLIVVPRANVAALEARKRLTPGLPEETSNLNCNFPEAEGESGDCALSGALWELVCSQEPDWLIDLHEGFDFTRINGKSVGSSVIAAKEPEVVDQARGMLDDLNETIADPNKQFVLKGPPVAGSFALAAADVLGVKSMILETTFKDQRISLRCRQHRIMVGRLLGGLGMVEHDSNVLVEADRVDGVVYGAIYDAGGVGTRGPGAIESDIGQGGDFVIRRVGEADIAGGALEQFDVLIVPGGSGSKQAAALGGDGCRAIVEFVEGGGGYVGFCGGAYLASNNYDWSLKIIDARVIDRKHWRRGTGQVDIEMTRAGRRILLDRGGMVDIMYANGPILEADEDPEIEDFETLAYYRTGIAKNGASEGVMESTPAMVCGRFGEGRVFCSSPHPEYTDGLEGIVRRAIVWASGREGL